MNRGPSPRPVRFTGCHARKLRAMRTITAREPDPLRVACPTCGAGKDQPCATAKEKPQGDRYCHTLPPSASMISALGWFSLDPGERDDEEVPQRPTRIALRDRGWIDGIGQEARITEAGRATLAEHEGSGERPVNEGERRAS